MPAMDGHPYFNRFPGQYTSHHQTPLGRRLPEEPLITRRGNIVYIANPFFRPYAMGGHGIQKLIVGKRLRDLLPNPAVIPDIDIIEEPGLLENVSISYAISRAALTCGPDSTEPGNRVSLSERIRHPRARKEL